MLTRDDVTELLALQAKAYDLLMWLAGEANHDPELLAPAVVARLREPASAAAWLVEQRAQLPPALALHDRVLPFATLLASFFATSFQVKHLTFDGRLVESRLTRGTAPDADSHVGIEQSLALAVKHLASSEDVAISGKQARRIAQRVAHREAVRIWTYVWELDRRVKDKGKGPVVHKIWRSLSWETRKALDVERVWQARAQLLAASRELSTRDDDA